MSEPSQVNPIGYFLASLAGIARALNDLGYHDEAGKLFRVQQDLEVKAAQREQK